MFCLVTAFTQSDSVLDRQHCLLLNQKLKQGNAILCCCHRKHPCLAETPDDFRQRFLVMRLKISATLIAALLAFEFIAGIDSRSPFRGAPCSHQDHDIGESSISWMRRAVHGSEVALTASPFSVLASWSYPTDGTSHDSSATPIRIAYPSQLFQATSGLHIASCNSVLLQPASDCADSTLSLVGNLANGPVVVNVSLFQPRLLFERGCLGALPSVTCRQLIPPPAGRFPRHSIGARPTPFRPAVH